MGIFTRFRDIVNANIGAMLDKAEDPDKMIRMMIREMEDTLIEIKSACAGAIANSRKLQRRVEAIGGQVTTWADRAELAVSKGRDDLAREALVEKRRFTEQEEMLQNELAEQDSLIEQYKLDIAELEDKLNSAKEKKRILVERHRQATGKKRAQQQVRRYNSSDTLNRFDKLESRIDQLEAEADLVNYAVKPTLEDEFAELSDDDEIENELAKIKSAQQNAAD